METPKSTVRFTQLVKECGRPEPVTLWTDLRKDPEFQSALRANRIMTVIQQTVGTHQDFGLVGFHRVEHGAYWMFPKSLKSFEGKRIVGIKYDQLIVPKPKDLVKPVAAPPKPMRKHERKGINNQIEVLAPEIQPKKSKSDLYRYRVVIRSIGIVENTHEIEAKSATEAKELALATVAKGPVEFPAEKVAREVVAVHRTGKT
jgi:hypothetical protein